MKKLRKTLSDLNMESEVIKNQINKRVPHEWKKKSIRETCDLLTGFPFKGNLYSKNEGIRVLRGENVSIGFLRWDSDKRWKYETEDVKKYFLKKGDIVIGMDGSRVGKNRAQIRDSDLPLLLAQRVACLRGLEEINQDFLAHIILDKKFENYVISDHTGTSIPHISGDQIKNFTFLVPPISQQKAIAEILSNLNSKIRVNEQMNTTLESIGQAVFKRWFVDFEFPNQEGKPYKSSGGEMTEAALGKIPISWKIGGLGDICEITMGQSPPGETYNETGDGVPFFQGIRDFGFRFPSKRVYCTAATRFATEGDVLLSVRAPVGSLNIADECCAIGRGVGALRLKEKPNDFLYYLLMSTRSGWDAYNANGTVFGSVTKQDVNEFKIIIPPKNLILDYGAIVEPLDQKILLNEKETRNLTIIRDSLLPKLMSGKIRVPIDNKMERL
jgi:type I restriction enzyme S subunit